MRDQTRSLIGGSTLYSCGGISKKKAKDLWKLNYKGTENSKLISLGHAYCDG